MNKLKVTQEEYESVCKNNGYCYKEMPKEDNKVLKYDHGEKFLKHPLIIYADLNVYLLFIWCYKK